MGKYGDFQKLFNIITDQRVEKAAEVYYHNITKTYKIRHNNLVCGSWVTFIKKKNQIYNYVTIARTGSKKSDIDDKVPLIMYRGLFYKWHKIKKKHISKKLHYFALLHIHYDFFLNYQLKRKCSSGVHKGAHT